jgi:hypothetical protein
MSTNPNKVLDELGVRDWPKVVERLAKEALEEVRDAKQATVDAKDDFKMVEKLVASTATAGFDAKDPNVQKVFSLSKKYRITMNDILKAYEAGGWQDGKETKGSPNVGKVMAKLGAADWPKLAETLQKEAADDSREAEEARRDVENDVKAVSKLVANTDEDNFSEKNPTVIKVFALAKRYKITPNEVMKAYEKGGW